MIFQKILLIMILVVTIMLLMSLVAYTSLKIYMWKTKDRELTKEEWKIME